jgi:hypothetical protein
LRKLGSEDAPYRVKLSNLPSNIRDEDLKKRLQIRSEASRLLILQPVDDNLDSPKVAYLIRQKYENELRQHIDQWHNTPFSSTSPQKIQCQLEVNQDLFEWNDFPEVVSSFDNSQCASPAQSIQSARSNRAKPIPRYSSAASAVGCQPNASKRSPAVEQSHMPRSLLTRQTSSSKKKDTLNSLRSRSGNKSIS